MYYLKLMEYIAASGRNKKLFFSSYTMELWNRASFMTRETLFDYWVNF